jgi:hypothetical protein
VAAKGQAVFAGEHQVEHHEVEPPCFEGARHRPAVGNGLDAQAMLAQEARQQIADLTVVVDDQNLRGVHHGTIVMGTRRTIRRREL